MFPVDDDPAADLALVRATPAAPLDDLEADLLAVRQRPAPMSAQVVAQSPARITTPIQRGASANGVTDPASVRITEPTPNDAHIGAATPGTAIPPITSGPLADAPAPLEAIIGAVREMFSNPQVLPLDAHVAPYGGAEREARIKTAAAEIVENVGRASEGVAGLGLIVNPVSTTVGLASAAAVGEGAKRAVAGIGGSPEDQRLAGDIASAAAAIYTTVKVRQGLAAGGAAARAARAAGPVPEPEPINVGHGSTAGARPRIGVEQEQPGLPAPPVPKPTPPDVAPPPPPPAAPVEPPVVVVPTEQVIRDLQAARAAGNEAGAQTAIAELKRRGVWDGVDRRAQEAIENAQTQRRRVDDLVTRPLPTAAQLAQDAATRNPALQDLSDRVSGTAVANPVTNETEQLEADLATVRAEAAIETARADVDPAPTDKQKEAGNYSKGHVTLHGLDITIENPVGSIRSGIGKDGYQWSVEMPADYGYIKRTEGADGDHVDVYIGPNPSSTKVYVVDQVDPDTREWDEHKAILGADSEDEARELYRQGFSDGRGEQRIGNITRVGVDTFKEWATNGDTSTPFRPITAKAGAKDPRVTVTQPDVTASRTYEAHADGKIRTTITIDGGSFTVRTYDGKQLVQEGGGAGTDADAREWAQKAFDDQLSVRAHRATVPTRLGGTLKEEPPTTPAPENEVQQIAADAGLNAPTVDEAPSPVTYNPDRGTIEVTFTSKPSPEVLQKLKGAGFRWARGARLWYDKLPKGVDPQQALKDARELLAETAAPPAAAPAPTAAMSRANVITKILAAARKPAPDAIEAFEGKGTNGQWYRLGANSLPVGVRFVEPPEKRSLGWVVRTEQGTTVGKRYDSREALLAAHTAMGDRDEADFRQALEEKDNAALAETAKFWLKEDISVTGEQTSIKPANNTPAPEPETDVAPPLVLRFGADDRVIPVASRAAATAKAREVIDAWQQEHGPGAADAFPGMTLHDAATGTVIADVSYNGTLVDRKKGVESPHGDQPGRVAGGERPAARESDTPAGGAGAAGPPDVAGEQPAAAGVVPDTGGVPTPRVRRPRSGGKRPSGGAPAARPGGESGGGAVADQTSHVDTADTAPSDDVADAEARGEAPRFFTITAASDLTEGGWVTKLDANLTALRLLKDLQAAGRPASDAEQALLARYIGWGHTDLAPIVRIGDDAPLDDPRKLQARQELQNLLTAREFQSLGESTINAHYSFHDLPRAMWALAQRLGFTGGSILEPAIGTGHFLGTMPPEIRGHRRTRVYGVDMEPIAAGIAQQLYQAARIQAAPLQEAVLPADYFDLIISNVPFGKVGIFDPAFVAQARTVMTQSVHNYYFGKALDLARPGGLILFVTSRYTLDARNDSVRQYLDERAVFLGAFRLPDQAFQKTAGTQVVTDVIVLQKRGEGVTTKGQPWTGVQQTASLTGPNGSKAFETNEYYHAHPEMVLGTQDATGKMARTRDPQYNVSGTVTPAQLADTVARFPPNVYKAAKGKPRKVADAKDMDARQGAFVIEGGKLYTFDKGTLTPSPLTGKNLARAIDFVPLRDAYQTVLEGNLARVSDADLAAAQKVLKRRYDAYVATHGPVNRSENRTVIEADPNAARIVTLENVEYVREQKGQRAKVVITGLADIFTKRLVVPPEEPTSATSAHDALITSRAWRGGVDLAFMAQLTGQPEAKLTQDLVNDLFKNPTTQTWEPKDEYLSGDVVTKLAQAQAAADLDDAYRGNVTALTAVQPTPITLDMFYAGGDGRAAPFGATWVPVDLVRRFLVENGGSDDVQVRLLNTDAKTAWYVYGWGAHEFKPQNVDYADWIADALNGRLPVVTVKDIITGSTYVDPELTEQLRQSLAQLREQWAEWWKVDPRASDTIVHVYNAMFNREVYQPISGEHLVLPNASPLIVLRPGQKDSVVRALQRGNTLLAQAVGWGKTFEMIAIASEWKRRGLARKPMIVVPNHLVDQWRRHYLEMYPTARVLLTTKEDYAAQKRRQLIARIANNDWDAVIVGLSQFVRIGVKVETLRAFIDEQEQQLLAEGAQQLGMTVEAFDELVTAYGDEDKKAKQRLNGRGAPKSAKDIARQILNLRKMLQKRLNQAQKDPIEFEDLGVDGLIVDEAHMYKNLYFSTAKNDVVGLKGSPSGRALDMFLKVKLINDASRQRNVVFATATPIANVMSELYTMFRYLDMEGLRRLGLGGFDAWANAYATAVGQPEPSPDGGYKERVRLRDWTNMRELYGLFRRFADVVTMEEVVSQGLLKLPTKKSISITTPAPPEMPDFMATIRDRIAALKTGKVDPRDDNHLFVSNHAAWAAIDLRLIPERFGGTPTSQPSSRNSRVAITAKEVATRYKASTAFRGTQLVFLDIGVPKAKQMPPLPASIGKIEVEPVEDDEEADDEIASEADDTAEREALSQGASDFNLYDELTRLMVKQGIKRDEIAYIHQAKSPDDLRRLFKAVQAGQVRVLLATREKGGTGMNVQDRIVAVHHVDVPWRPDQMEQANGRGVRQGNLNASVDEVRYITPGSFDQYKWGLLATKQGYISGFMRGEVGNMEDVDPNQLDMQLNSALASGDPRIFQMIQAERALVGMRARAANFTMRNAAAKREVKVLEERLARYAATLAQYREAQTALTAWHAAGAQVVLDTKPGRFFGFDTTPDRSFALGDTESRARLNAAFRPFMEVDYVTREGARIGHAGPYDLWVMQTTRTETTVEGIFIKQTDFKENMVVVKLGTSMQGNTPPWDASNPPDLVRSLSYHLAPERLTKSIETAEAGQTNTRDELALTQKVASKTFDQSDALAAKEKELADLRAAVDADQQASAATNAPQSGTTLQMAVVPGAAEFGEYVLTPAAEKVAALVKHERALVLSVLAPTRIGVAPLAADVIRAHNAAHDQRVERAGRVLEAVRREMDGWSHDQSRAFWDVMEGLEDADTLPASVRPTVQLFRTIITRWTEALVEADLIETYIEHYFPHEWQKGTIEGNALRKLFGRRPMQGPESFRKHRTLATMRAGLEAGFEPLSWNPAVQLQRKIVEMSRSLNAREMQRDLKEQGLEVYVPATQRPPEAIAHWRKVPEAALGTVYGPRVPEQTFGRVLAGHYYAPPEVVRLLENYVSPGLWGTSLIFDAYKALGNASTSLLLGWSSFHLWLTGLESVISKQALVAELTARGELAAAAKKQLEVGPQGVVRDLVRGYRAVQHFYARDADANDITGILGQIIQGGGGLGWSLFEHEDAPRKFMTDLRQLLGAVRRMEPGTAATASAKAAAHGAMAAFELPTSLIMNQWVPYLKVSAFLDLAEMELRGLPADASLADKRAVLGKAWDAVEDRFGQLRYANLFWDNTFKQILTGGFLSVGWQVGSIRHGLGAFGQVPRAGRWVKRRIEGGGSGGGSGRPPGAPPPAGASDAPLRRPGDERFVQREAAWLFTLVAIVAVLSALKQYLATGKRPGEDKDGEEDPRLALRDLFYPRNGIIDVHGREQRDALISYAKDYYGWTHHPITTLEHKLKPILHTLAELVENEDFFGDAIYDADDPVLTRLGDVLAHVAESHEPIGVQNALRRAGEGASLPALLKAWGLTQLSAFTPASAEIERSAAENYLQGLRPPMHRTKDEAARAATRRDVRSKLRAGDRAGAAAAGREGGLTPQSLRSIARGERIGPLRSAFQSTTWPQAVHTMELASPAERHALRQPFIAKFSRAMADTRGASARKDVIAARNRILGLEATGQM